MRHRGLLPWIVLVYLVLAAIYAVVIPLGEAPDEPSHILCIIDAFENRRVPRTVYPEDNMSVRNREYILSRYECLHPPLYALLNAGIWRAAQWLGLGNANLIVQFPPTNPGFGSLSGVMFVPEKPGLWKPTTEEMGVLIVRVTGILMGAGTVMLTFGIAQKLFPGELTAAASAGTVALLPQFLFISRSVNNDNLALLLSAATLYTLLRPRRDAIALSALCSLGLMTKLTNLFLIPLVGIDLQFRAGSSSRGHWLLRHVAPVALGWLVLIALYAFFPELRENLAHSGKHFGRVRQDALQFEYWQDVLAFLSASFWAAFGWVSIRAPRVLTTQLSIWLMLGLASYGLWLWRRRGLLGGSMKQRHILAIAGVTLVAVQFGWMNLTLFQPQGRFLFPALPLLASWASFGWLRWLPERNRATVTVVMLFLLLGVNVYLLAERLVPAYGAAG